ncbi:MAG: O-acetyl-ADP-ribose deacetylase [Ferruginibacter sp.]
MKIELLKKDITKMNADAIVNAANSSLLGGGGVDGAIHRAGGNAILEACMAIRNKQGGCEAGEAVITTGGNLPARFVIHTVGPVWNGDKEEKKQLLAACYKNSLKLADEYKLTSIAFPNISTGIYHFPKDKAAVIAVDSVITFLKTNANTSIKEISFVCFDDENYILYAALMPFVTKLYRPVNQAELDLVEQSGWKKFPPRLPDQPIFYPVTNEAYADQISKEWNVPAYGIGHVVAFDLASTYLKKYNVENVGGEIHNEYWIPADGLEEMNHNILGKIELIRTFR